MARFGLVKNPDEELYNSDEWAARRTAYADYLSWFRGDSIRDPESSISDPATGDRPKLYPLALNPIGKVCRVHRDVLIGIQPHNVLSNPVQIVVKPGGDSSTSRAEATSIQDLLRSTWDDSEATALIQRVGLMTQVFGGYGLQVLWQPQDTELATRLRIFPVTPGTLLPVYDKGQWWNLRECYIGYLISSVDAARYGVKVDENEDALYMEHWTPDSYVIRVNGKVAQVEGYGILEGPHPFKRVPIVYIPHIRDDGFWGNSHIPDLVGLTREKNFRSADKGDAVREVTHPIMTVANVEKGLKMQPVLDEHGREVSTALNLGVKRAAPNSGDPKADFLRYPEVPASLANYDAELWNEIRRQADIAAVALGDDDVSGGRITGPVTAYRMWPTMAHTQAERIDFSTAMRHLNRIILAGLMGYGNALTQAGVTLPVNLSEDHLRLNQLLIWNPQIPLEVSERADMLNNRLTKGGISLLSYLTEIGVHDPEAEQDRIRADMEFENELEIKRATAIAESKPAPFGGGQPSGNGQNAPVPVPAGVPK
ncbi:MAG: hypothetical protein XU15_C0011G0122 [candidate division NC10 bacterium CSP1-5]|nr:MAG: hypothetical protein XU15_C0011G0122 [candidate division NC10 bacterium CSP1-5]